MKTFAKRLSYILQAISVVYGATLWVATPAAADGLPVPALRPCQTITLHCENSRVYGLCPIAVTDVGELVTARLSTPASMHVRLIPMGDGYRYAGKGVWFDGKESVGRLYFGQHRSVACNVAW